MEQLPASRWAKLSAAHIVRLGELTKREIQVLSVLFLCRNGSNNRCNPRRKTIAQLGGLSPPHITVALAGLESKGWVIEMPDGDFHLFEANEIPPVEKSVENSGKVTKLVTTGPEPETAKVTKLVTKITKSVTENYQIGNSLNKDLNRQLNKQSTDKARAPRKPRTNPPKAKRKSVATRIPEPFELTDGMIDWAKSTLPLLRLAEAHENFVEYWTNCQTKKAIASNWLMRWKKGMKLLLRWQIRDDRLAGKTVVDPDCTECGGTDGRVRTSTDVYPCPVCLPVQYAQRFPSRRK